jgi:hypothetical protein
MTFTHKFARRFAILRAPLPHCAMLSSVALTVAWFTGVPAYAEGVPGDSLVTSIEWTATGGAIALDGTYSSPSTGDFKVVGNRPGPNRTTSDTSTVTVVPAQPTLATVVVSPEAATAAVSSRDTFGALGRLSDGSTVAIGVTWTATGGTIDSGGVYTAGETEGSYRVIARAASADVADTVPVTIKSTRTATPHDPFAFPPPRNKDGGEGDKGRKTPPNGPIRDRTVEGYVRTPESETWIKVTERWWKLEVIVAAGLLASLGLGVRYQRQSRA